MIASKSTIAPASVADHYDELDPFYREIWGEHVHHGLWLRGDESPDIAVEQMVHLVAEKAAIREGQRVCDIGCGYGAAARLLARERQTSVTAITLSAAQCSYAKKLYPSSNPNYLLADWSTMPRLPERFDAAFAIESSEHMADKRLFFTRALETLKPGGRLVVCSWLAAEKPAGWQQKWLLEPICREGRMPHLLNAGELVALASKAGFIAVEQKELSEKVSRTWSIVIARFVGRLFSDSRYRSFLLAPDRPNKNFAAAIVRIWLAYKTRAMKYAIFTFVK